MSGLLLLENPSSDHPSFDYESREDVYGPQSFPWEFPKNIFQTGSEEQQVQWENQTRTWTDLNPGWEYNFLSDESNTLYVEKHFAHRPALLDFWHNLNTTILRADLIRYLSMLADGGVYSDMDTSCLESIDEWITLSQKDASTSLSGINAVVGVEYDDTSYQMFVRPVSFSQWTLMAKPGHPIFQTVVDRVISRLEYLARIRGVRLPHLEIEKLEVLEATGPGAFTDAVMEVLSNTVGRPVDWEEVQNLMVPKQFGDILILPINGFGSGQKHSHSGDPKYGPALAKHHFGRSWYVQPPPPAEPVAARQ